jgi:hypothetical protein
MKFDKRNTSLPERCQREYPPPEKKPKWSKLLRMVLLGVLVWMPRLWKLLEIIFGWFNRSQL